MDYLSLLKILFEFLKNSSDKEKAPFNIFSNPVLSKKQTESPEKSDNSEKKQNSVSNQNLLKDKLFLTMREHDEFVKRVKNKN